MNHQTHPERELHNGWASPLARASMALLLFEGISGLAITFSPFHAAVQWSVIVHTLTGGAMLLPLAWYCTRHVLECRRYVMSHMVLLGYVALAGLVICAGSGVVVTWEGLLRIRTSGFWRQTHLISTYVLLGTVLPHISFSFVRVWRDGPREAARRYMIVTFGGIAAGLSIIVALNLGYPGVRYA